MMSLIRLNTCWYRSVTIVYYIVHHAHRPYLVHDLKGHGEHHVVDDGPDHGLAALAALVLEGGRDAGAVAAVGVQLGVAGELDVDLPLVNEWQKVNVKNKGQ